MKQSTQQTSLFSAVAEQSLAWGRLAVTAEQPASLHNGGAKYIADFITADEEAALLGAADAATWQTDLQRRVQHYGYRYNYTKRNINADSRLGVLPQWSGAIVERLMQEKIFATQPEQLIVNEYQPGQGIAPHTDRDCFGAVVVSLSLGSDCMMRIMPQCKSQQGGFDLVLLRRSLIVFQGDSRHIWRHGIAPRQSDQQNGNKIPRQRRVSLTFRTVNNESASPKSG